MKKSGSVGIMVANRHQRKYALLQHLRYKTASISLFSFTPSSIDWKRRRITGLYRANGRWAVGHFPFPVVVYNRCYGTDPALMERLEKTIGPRKCFNRTNQLNKSEVHGCLSRWLSDYLPETFAYGEADEYAMLEKHKVVYFKPVYGHKGLGVYRAELMDTGKIHVGHHYYSPKTILDDAARFREHIRKLLGSTAYIVQQGVPIRQIRGQIFDIRVLVQKNERGLWSVTNLISRIAYKGSYNTSIYDKAMLSRKILQSLYPADRIEPILTSIYNVSLRATEIIEMGTDNHLGELSVDIALDRDAHPWIIELNGKPQKEIYNGIPNRSDVYMRPLQYARYLCGR